MKLDKRIRGPAIVLCEGVTTLRFCEHAYGRLVGTPDGVEFFDYGGVTQLQTYLHGLRGTTGFSEDIEAMLIVRDAETSPDPARSVTDALSRTGFDQPPDRPYLFSGAKPRIAFALLPGLDNDGKPLQGSVEDLCLQAVAESPFMTCIDKLQACQHEVREEAKSGEKYRVKRQSPSKLRAHVYLALCGFAGKQIGTATKAGVWGDLSDDCFQPLATLFRQLRSV